MDAATLVSIVDDECALLAVVDCMSCMRSRRVVPQHRDKGLDGVINSRAYVGTRRKRTAALVVTETRKGFATGAEVVS